MSIDNNDKKQQNSMRYTPIHKIIDNTYQLSNIQKERVLLAFKEGVIKGFTIEAMPALIEAKTGIKVSIKFIYTLRRLEYLDNKEWYYNLARDNFAYIGVYRRVIDELELARQECWHLILHPNTDAPTKVQCLREIHNIVKTQVLLIRDLPFIMNLSKYYDPKILDPDNKALNKLSNSTPSLPGYKDKDYVKPQPQNPQDSFLHKAVYGAVDKDTNTNLAAQTLDDIGKQGHLKDVDANVMKTMHEQLTSSGVKNREQIQQEYEASQQKGNDALLRVVEDIESALKGEFKTTGKIDPSNVRKLIQKSEASLSYLDSLIGPQEKESVKRLKELIDK